MLFKLSQNKTMNFFFSVTNFALLNLIIFHKTLFLFKKHCEIIDFNKYFVFQTKNRQFEIILDELE